MPAMKIDVFCHIFPETFYQRMLSISGSGQYMQKRVRGIPSIMDLDVRFRMMDKFPDYFQVISLAAPPIEMMGEPQLTVELARLANDGMAELIAKHPDRFLGFVASFAMNDVEASLAEIDRAILRLGATGIQIFTNVNGRPLDDPAYLQIFRRMAE